MWLKKLNEAKSPSTAWIMYRPCLKPLVRESARQILASETAVATSTAVQPAAYTAASASLQPLPPAPSVPAAASGSRKAWMNRVICMSSGKSGLCLGSAGSPKSNSGSSMHASVPANTAARLKRKKVVFLMKSMKKA